MRDGKEWERSGAITEGAKLTELMKTVQVTFVAAAIPLTIAPEWRKKIWNGKKYTHTELKLWKLVRNWTPTILLPLITQSSHSKANILTSQWRYEITLWHAELENEQAKGQSYLVLVLAGLRMWHFSPIQHSTIHFSISSHEVLTWLIRSFFCRPSCQSSPSLCCYDDDHINDENGSSSVVRKSHLIE